MITQKGITSESHISFQNDENLSNTFREPIKIGLSEELDQCKIPKNILWKFLPTKKEGEKEYTLVLDMDETLIHYPENPIEEHDQDWYNLRPGLHKFLETMSKYFEIIIFTAGTQDYADYILDQVDFQKRISHRLYRQHTTQVGEVFTKDLGRLGRDLSKMVIVDNLSENFEKQKRNGIKIKSWYDNLEDTVLSDLSIILEEIVMRKPNDIRLQLEKQRDVLNKYTAKGESLPRVSIIL